MTAPSAQRTDDRPAAATEQPAPHQLSFTVYGAPIPQGSKVAISTGSGARLIDDNPGLLRPWRRIVTAAAREAMRDTPGWSGDYPAVIAHFAFTFVRPGNHYQPAAPTLGRGVRSVLRADAPRIHAVKPDLDKLVRAVCDSLTDAGAFADDCRIAQLHAVKVYAAEPAGPPNGSGALDRPGVRIVLAGVNR